MIFIEKIYTTLSFIALFALIIIFVKFVTKRLKKKGLDFFKKADTMLIKIHKLASIILVVSAMLHGILTLFRFSEFGGKPYILGAFSLLSAIAAIGSFKIKNKFKSKKHWLIHHRIFAVISIITFAVHIALSR